MKKMKRTSWLLLALAGGTLLTSGAGAEVSAVSSEAVLDTRTYTVDWSNVLAVNTKKIVGTILCLR